MIRRVLDYVLEARNETRTKDSNSEVGSGNGAVYDPMLMAGFNEMDDLDWLNTIDWTQQGSWMDLNP